MKWIAMFVVRIPSFPEVGLTIFLQLSNLFFVLYAGRYFEWSDIIILFSYTVILIGSRLIAEGNPSFFSRHSKSFLKWPHITYLLHLFPLASWPFVPIITECANMIPSIIWFLNSSFLKPQLKMLILCKKLTLSNGLEGFFVCFNLKFK